MRGRWVAIAVFLLGALAAGVSWMLRVRKETLPPAPQAYVATSWDTVRDSPGHRVHVDKLHKPCTGCHQAADGGLNRPTSEVCVECHEAASKIQHARAAVGLVDDASVHRERGDAGAAPDSSVGPPPEMVAAGLSSCTDCHGFGLDTQHKPSDCIRCHQHPQGPLHSVATHATAPCQACHDVHRNETVAQDCTTCHDVRVKHGHGGADVATQCRVCHDVHASAPFTQDSCLKCHGPKGVQPVPHTAIFAEGHTCDSCHRPHQFDKTQVQRCTECHKTAHPLAGHERQNCVGCHQPHAVRAQIEGGAVCSTCHEDVALTHAGKHNGDLGACIGCHVPHPAKPSKGPEACTSCHQDIGGATHTAHAKTLTCNNCHEPHAFHLELNIGLCRDCHAAQVTALQKRSEHKECTSCHQGLPHTVGSPVQPCGACHKEIKSKVHEGHAECRNCHQPHQASVQLQSCEQCHAKEAKQHPRGHDQCMKCHDQHVSEPKPGVADCSACHKAKKLSGLHKEAKHLENGCQQCHAPHGVTPPGDRQACLSCHKDRVDHQPEATRCDGCHTFIGVQSGRAP